jgi:hypothetical protein
MCSLKGNDPGHLLSSKAVMKGDEKFVGIEHRILGCLSNIIFILYFMYYPRLKNETQGMG